MAPKTKYWLSLLYKADVLGQGNYAKVMVLAKEDKTDDFLASLAELSATDKKRQGKDYITAKQVSYLQEMLA